MIAVMITSCFLFFYSSFISKFLPTSSVELSSLSPPPSLPKFDNEVFSEIKKLVIEMLQEKERGKGNSRRIKSSFLRKPK